MASGKFVPTGHKKEQKQKKYSPETRPENTSRDRDDGDQRDEKEDQESETHLDFSSTQPNRPSDLFAHGGGRKAGLEMIH